jgi:hypothetical protein
MEERLRSVSLAESGRFEFVQLCKDFGISRKNGYKWSNKGVGSNKGVKGVKRLKLVSIHPASVENGFLWDGRSASSILVPFTT